ncbi:MAG: hypothetical protein J7K87_02110 [Candidatus Aenigmarchaeota archaeon]|nr:hypothetical protein [Candidatus Aenigmarchaeota archaeon]
MKMGNISGITYESSGVSIRDQNWVNKKVVESLGGLGMKVEGLFGGAISIPPYEEIYVGLSGASVRAGSPSTRSAGTLTAERAFKKVNGTPVGVLDYFASPFMDKRVVDFVKGVAKKSLKNKTPVIGGESAQMQGTYKEGMYDGFVHVIELRKEKDEYSCDITKLVKKMEVPLLVASTDGVGTKTKIVRNPLDIIYHGFNDIGALGVKPIAFGIYIAGNVSENELVEIEKKSDTACKDLGITKLEPIVEYKPRIYIEGEVDIAGTVLGVIDRKNLITGENVKEGDVIIGIGVDAIMTNGYTLARKIGEELVKDWDASMKEFGGKSFREELSKSHVPMTDILFGADDLEGILSKYPGSVKATAHITGGGQEDNIKRMIPDGLCAKVERNVLPIPPVMKYFIENGLSVDEAYRTFNMGVGFTLTVPEEKSDEIINYINKNFRNRLWCERPAAQIGRIVKGNKKFVFK